MFSGSLKALFSGCLPCRRSVFAAAGAL